MDPGMNQLLKWSIENSETAAADPSAPSNPNAQQSSSRPLNGDALRTLMGGPSDADLMRESMAAVASPDVTLGDKLIAFDNFEQLIENLDNANNMDVLGLWEPLTYIITSEEPELRRYAAWCVGTAVQNNERAQAKLLSIGAVPKIVKLALDDPSEPVRRKAIYALSSEVRNFQTGLDQVVKALPKGMAPEGGLDAGDMEVVDRIIGHLREASARKAA